jgi:hypothetical protein
MTGRLGCGGVQLLQARHPTGRLLPPGGDLRTSGLGLSGDLGA